MPLRARAPRALRVTLASVLSVALSLGALAVAPAPAGAVLPEPLTQVVLDGEVGEPITGGTRRSFSTVTAVLGFADTTVSLDLGTGDAYRRVALASPVGQSLAVGVYENALRFNVDAPGRPGLEVTGGGVGCNQVSGRFVVDELTRNGDGSLRSFAARFEHHCDGAPGTLFGSVSYNATADFRTRALGANALVFPNTFAGATAPTQPVSIVNDGPSPVTISGAQVAGTGSSQFRSDGGCVGVTLAAQQQCTINVTFQPTSGGGKSAHLSILDDSLPPGPNGSGRKVALSGFGLTPPDPYGEYTPLTPRRILDTRTGLARSGSVGPGEEIEVPVAGRGGVPSTGALAVVMNVTVAEPTAPGYLTVWPTGDARPDISNLNFQPGQTVPNLVTVALGIDGRVSVFNESGASHVLFDVVGFYSDGDGPLGTRYRPLSPQRLLDTRDGTGGVPATAIGPGATLDLRAVEQFGVPSWAPAVVLNVTVTRPSASGYLSVFPAGAERPNVSNLNFVAGQTIANLVTVRVPPSGLVSFFNETGSTHVIADIVGWYGEDRSSESGRFVPFEPLRVFDSRVASPFDGDGSLPEGGILVQSQTPSGAWALMYNVTAVQPTADGYLTVFPEAPPVPNASNLNFSPGRNVPNLVIARRGANGWVLFFNSAGRTHLLIDVFGAFTNGSVSPQALRAGLTSASIDRSAS